MHDYFANKNKHRLIVKNVYKNMAIYLKNRLNKYLMLFSKGTMYVVDMIVNSIMY